MDIHHFTQMEQETGWSKELLYQLVESVKDYAIFVSDLNGQIVSWNIGAEKIFGYPAKEAIGQNCRILLQVYAHFDTPSVYNCLYQDFNFLPVTILYPFEIKGSVIYLTYFNQKPTCY